MRGKLLKLNTFTSLANQIVTIICGFVLPRLILEAYGSEVNGLVNSIIQFLQIITFLELGVGAVVQSALYKPLAEKDGDAISRIMVSAQKFFNRLAGILLVYVALLIAVYPFIAEQDFGWAYTALLIAAISISSFAQYFFGLTDGLLLRSDQRGYIQYTAQLITVILNTAACMILIRLGFGIHVVKLTTSLIYLARPIAVRIYIGRHYRIDRRIEYTGEPIRQKWNGVAQHVAAVVLDGTSNIVLTVFSTLSNVSIYSVYHLVVYGVKNLFLSMTGGIQSLIGELWAKNETEELKGTFAWLEWIVHTGTVFIFGCVGILIVPFVKIYTAGINDVNYVQPFFAVLITLANAFHCLRLPYSVMILAGGHYKETQGNYIIAAAINIVISVAAVIMFGLVGVAVGPLVAMVFQTVWMAYYVSRSLIKWEFKRFIKQTAVDIITVLAAFAATFWIKLASVDYISWIVMAIEVAAIFLAVILIINLIFYREKLAFFIKKLKRSK